MIKAITGGSLIQSNFGAGNFEAVVFEPLISDEKYGTPLQSYDYLQGYEPPPESTPDSWQLKGALRHYWLDTSQSDRTWSHGEVPITKEAIGPGCIIQSNFGAAGNFEVVVPEKDGLVHYWHNNDDMSDPWSQPIMIAPGVTGAASMVQNSGNGNLEVVALHGHELCHYWRDTAGWHRWGVITDKATGPACLIQTTYVHKLQLVVLEGSNLVHYFQDESEAPALKWKFGGVITNKATGPAGFFQGTYGNANANPNFEVVVPEGDTLVHYWRDNTDANLPWYNGGIITHRAGPINAATLIQSSFDKNLEVLSQENTGSIYHYYRYRDGHRLRWFRGACLKVAELDIPDVDRSKPMSTKIIQLTGDAGSVVHKPDGCPGIRGTDLGSSFLHQGQYYFLFGDTHWENCDKWKTFDAIARTSERDAARGLHLQFHCSYLLIDPAVSQREYEVPLDGFSFKENMFVFFSTGYCRHYHLGTEKHRKVMGHSILTRCVETNPDFDTSSPDTPLKFKYLSQFSHNKFINVSVEMVEAEAIATYHLPAREKGLLIWGTGSYRNDNMYLAFLNLDDERMTDNLFSSTPIAFNQLGVTFFAGEKNGEPTWSVREEDAVPLFYPAAIGELSVRWNSKLNRWVCMYGSGPEDPIGLAIVMRIAHKPWGPWSRRRLVLDWVADGMGYRVGPNRQPRFIHDAKVSPTDPDNPGDNIIEPPVNRGGAAYAPYQLPHHTRGTPLGFILYYVLSTWNPYQVVQMRHEIRFSELAALG